MEDKLDPVPGTWRPAVRVPGWVTGGPSAASRVTPGGRGISLEFPRRLPETGLRSPGCSSPGHAVGAFSQLCVSLLVRSHLGRTLPPADSAGHAGRPALRWGPQMLAPWAGSGSPQPPAPRGGGNRPHRAPGPPGRGGTQWSTVERRGGGSHVCAMSTALSGPVRKGGGSWGSREGRG